MSQPSEEICFTYDEYYRLRRAFQTAMAMMHYADKDHVTGLPRFDRNVAIALGEMGPVYRMIKAKADKVKINEKDNT